MLPFIFQYKWSMSALGETTVWGKHFHLRWVLGCCAVLTLRLFAQTSPPNGFRKSREPWENRARCGGARDSWRGSREIVCGSAPFPLQLHLAGRVTAHCFCWQHYCKLCMLKTTIFLSSYFDRDFFFSLNSNSSLIALLPSTWNFLGLLLCHGVSKAVSQWYFYLEWDYGYVSKQRNSKYFRGITYALVQSYESGAKPCRDRWCLQGRVLKMGYLNLAPCCFYSHLYILHSLGRDANKQNNLSQNPGS